MKSTQALLLGVSVLLTGCATPGLYNTPVEERSTKVVPRQDNGIVTPVNPATGVTVTPVAPTPVIRAQRPADAGVNQGFGSTNTSEPEISSSVPVPVSPVAVKSSQNPAVVALLDTARQQTHQGDLRSAQSSLQRAQRIAPKDPEVYYVLADTHRRLGEFLQAEQVALKGVATAQGQNTQLRRLWQLIAAIRTDAGDLEGAEKAAGVARRY